MNQFIDTHIHLDDSDFNDDLPSVLDRALDLGINRFILPAVDSSSHQKIYELSNLYPKLVFPAIGLHPTSVKSDWEKELAFVFDKITKSHYYAIGEIGMDGFWSKEFMKEQSIVFEKQIELANTHNLPIIIHSRDATEEIFKVLERSKHLNISGVFHAFSGSYETFLKLSGLGNFKIGIGGVLTFKNASLVNVVERIGLDNIVLETDAPWLTPAPYRGKRNEPSYISIIAEKLAEIKGCTIEEIARKTTENAVKLFKL